MPSAVKVAHRIGGEWAMSGEVRDGRNPARPDDVVALTPVGDAGQAAEALAAARQALPGWARMPAPERGTILFRAAELLSDRAPAIGEELSREEGKTRAEAIGEVRRAAAILRYFAGRTMEPIGEVYASASPGTRLHTIRQPVGVVAVVTPWNFPIAIPAWKVAPALAYGNTVLLKAASATPLTAFRLVEALVDAGLPPGTINLVHVSGAIAQEAWLGRDRVDALSFTGSESVGRQLQERAVRNHIKVQLELGGKNAAVVAPDADIEFTAEMIARGAFMSAGQKCTATSRVIAIGPALASLRTALTEQVARMVVGDPLDEHTVVGPVIDADAQGRIEGVVVTAIDTGARVVARGSCPRGGWFSPPVVLDELSPLDSVVQEEVFGPVVGILEAADVDDALRIHDDVAYGLSASVFTRDLVVADAFVQRARAGIIHVNGETAGAEPHVGFGGMKDSSSWSREQGHSAEDFYTQTKTVYWDAMQPAGLFDAIVPRRNGARAQDSVRSHITDAPITDGRIDG